MEKYVLDYKSFLTLNKGCSDNTVLSYLSDVKLFSNYLKIINNYDITLVSSDVIESFVVSQKAQGRAINTISRCVASLRNFYTFLVLKGHIDFNPAKDIKIEKKEKKLPKNITAKEIDILLNLPNTEDPKGCRDKAMFELLYATGIRVSELIALNIENINFSLATLNFQDSKGERVIPIYPEALNAISIYLTRVRAAIISKDSKNSLFTNLQGQRLTRQGFWKIIKCYVDNAGIKFEVTPNIMRHSFAIHLLENGAPLADVQQMLGHNDISSTQVYSNVINSKLNSSYKKYHPKAQIKISARKKG